METEAEQADDGVCRKWHATDAILQGLGVGDEREEE
jgi:hypothetical protein